MILTVRQSKFRKSRLLPLHPSTVSAVRHYVEQRDLLLTRCRDFLLVSDLGRPLEVSAVRRTFYELSHWTGLRKGAFNRGPRLHDFRHRFALQTMIGWYRAGLEVQRRLPVLSTAVHPYLTALGPRECPEIVSLGPCAHPR